LKEAVSLDAGLILSLQDYLSVLGFAEDGVLVDENFRRFGKVEVFPSWIGEAFNKLKRLGISNAVVTLAFFRPCLKQDQLPRIFVRHAPNGLQGVLIDRDAIIHSNHFEPAVIVCDEDVLAIFGEILRDKETSVMCGGKQGEFIEAMINIGAFRPGLGVFALGGALRPGGLRANIEELGQFGRVEIAESLDNHVIVVPKLDSEVNLVLIHK
jgi:hypothetical protein